MRANILYHKGLLYCINFLQNEHFAVILILRFFWAKLHYVAF